MPLSFIYTGVTRKMKSKKENNSIVYNFVIGEDLILLNDYIDQYISIKYLNKIFCQACNKQISKSYFQGYCYPCMISAPQTSECILRPELCRAHEGQSRDMAWAKEHCLNDHIVYLAITSGLKVGVTRSTQAPTRWIDQGAVEAIELARVPNRYLAGELEVKIKQHVADKTHWQKMLKSEYNASIDLQEEKEKIIKLLGDTCKDYILHNSSITKNIFPIKKNPQKIKSLNFDKKNSIQGYLTGIKGQYLMFDNETVFNVRRHTGYMLEMEIYK